MKAIIILICISFIFASSHFNTADYADDKLYHHVTELTNLLRTKSVDQLRSYSHKVDSWVRQEKGLNLREGVNDYITRLDSEGCIKYIISLGYQNKQLFDIEFFLNNIATKQEEEKEKQFLSMENEQTTDNAGLQEIIYNLDHKTLIKYALATERFECEKKGCKYLIGRLRDDGLSMGNSDYAYYIMKKAKKFPELNSKETLDKLTNDYGMDDNNRLPDIILTQI